MLLTLGVMSEKRQRQQQRRQRRKTQSRSRATGQTAPGLSSLADTEAELSALFVDLAKLAARDADGPRDSLDAEQWASSLLGVMHALPMLPDQDLAELFVPGLVAALEALGTRRALATLRALTAVVDPDHAVFARAAGDRLLAAGQPEPSWAPHLGGVQPTVAALMSEEAFDDGFSVMVEFAGPNVETHTVGIYVDHNLGGLVKDAFLAGPLAEVRGQLERQAAGEATVAVRDLDLAEARARVEGAFEMLDRTWDPPINEDVPGLRALVEARLRALPQGFVRPDDNHEIDHAAREVLLEGFLSSPQGGHWRGDEEAEGVIGLAIEFGADYNHGGPLRWSPAVVEIFMTSWLARKVTREPSFFARVPDVMRDWVEYAGRQRGVPAAPLREAVAAVDLFRGELLETVNDPHAWGPAKSFAIAALDAGVDLTNPDDVQRFVDHYNQGLAA